MVFDVTDISPHTAVYRVQTFPGNIRDKIIIGKQHIVTQCFETCLLIDLRYIINYQQHISETLYGIFIATSRCTFIRRIYLIRNTSKFPKAIATLFLSLNITWKSIPNFSHTSLNPLHRVTKVLYHQHIIISSA